MTNGYILIPVTVDSSPPKCETQLSNTPDHHADVGNSPMVTSGSLETNGSVRCDISESVHCLNTTDTAKSQMVIPKSYDAESPITYKQSELVPLNRRSQLNSVSLHFKGWITCDFSRSHHESDVRHAPQTYCHICSSWSCKEKRSDPPIIRHTLCTRP